jgi:hypothetical protein
VGFAAPRSPSPTTDERELLLGFASWQRAQVVATADGLTEAQLRWTPDARLLPIIGVINHLAHMEWRWVEARYLGSGFPSRTEEFVVGDDVTGAQVVDAYWRQAERTEAIVRAAPTLDAPCLGDEGGRGPAHVLGSTSRSTCAGCCCTSSRRPRTTPVTPTPLARCSTARRCAPDDQDRQQPQRSQRSPLSRKIASPIRAPGVASAACRSLMPAAVGG